MSAVIDVLLTILIVVGILGWCMRGVTVVIKWLLERRKPAPAPLPPIDEDALLEVSGTFYALMTVWRSKGATVTDINEIWDSLSQRERSCLAVYGVRWSAALVDKQMPRDEGDEFIRACAMRVALERSKQH